MASRIARTALILALATLAVACTKTLDTTNLRNSLQAQLRTELASSDLVVHCPDGVKVEAGATFTCTATDGSGRSLTLQITQKDDKGNVTWKIVGATGGPTSTTSPVATPTA